jgi:hypothetical protein
MIRRFTAATSALALLAACSTSGTAPQSKDGSYTATVTGDRQFTLSGRALRAPNTSGQLDIIAMARNPDVQGPDTTIVLDFQNPPGVTAGTHTVAEWTNTSPLSMGMFFTTATGVTRGWESASANSGTVTITRTSPNVEGDFSADLEGRDINGNNLEHVHVTGHFATPIP